MLAINHLLFTTTHHLPPTAHRSPLTAHRSPLTAHCSPLTVHRSPLTAHHSPLTAHHSPLTTHRSPLTAHRSLLTAHRSPPHCSPFTAHRSPLPQFPFLCTAIFSGEPNEHKHTSICLSKVKSKITLIASIGIALFAFLFIQSTAKTPMTAQSNPQLKTYKPNSNWAGNPLDEKGRYQNIYHPFIAKFGDVLKWMRSKNPQRKAKKNESRRLPNAFHPDVFNTKEDYLIWLGHASYLIQLNGKRYITDPVFYNPWFLKRESDFPFDLKYLPSIDYLLLSHNHRDHCDKKSIQYLAKTNPNLTVLTGLGMQNVIGSWLKNQKVEEAGWYQAFASGEPDVEIVFTPARHWSKRGLNDDNTSLWGGFYIKPENKKSIFFMGDSGYTPVFKDIQRVLGSPDYCIMGVGAYLPEWFMHQAHMGPLDAIKVFNEMGGKYFIPMHYGTFDLSDEPRLQPWDVLEEHKQSIQGKLIEGVLGKNLL